MIIKPHHFMDIIKLYGAGLEVFVPDLSYGHDFYRVANAVVADRSILLTLTAGADDICSPCRYLGQDGTCQDSISHINGMTSKNQYNEMLDRRIMAILGMSSGESYKAETLCRRMQEQPELVEAVWKEEDEAAMIRRKSLFQKGIKRYLEC